MYNKETHRTFAERCQNLARELKQLYVEAGVLEDIYNEQAGSGTDAAFRDTRIATAAELQEAIVLCHRLRDALALDGQSQVLTPEDQTARLTPFLQ